MTIDEEVAKAHELCEAISLDEQTQTAMEAAQKAGIGPATFVFVMLEWVACVCAYLTTSDGDDEGIDNLVNTFRTLLTAAFEEKKDGL